MEKKLSFSQGRFQEAYSMLLYAIFRAYWAFLGLPRPFSASLGPFKAYLRLLRKTLFNKNYICIPIKKTNPTYWALEKTCFWRKKQRSLALDHEYSIKKTQQISINVTHVLLEVNTYLNVKHVVRSISVFGGSQRLTGHHSHNHQIVGQLDLSVPNTRSWSR